MADYDVDVDEVLHGIPTPAGFQPNAEVPLHSGLSTLSVESSSHDINRATTLSSQPEFRVSENPSGMQNLQSQTNFQVIREELPPYGSSDRQRQQPRLSEPSEIHFKVESPHPSANLHRHREKTPQNHVLMVWNGSLYFIVGIVILIMSIVQQKSLDTHCDLKYCCRAYRQACDYRNRKTVFEYSVCQSKYARKYNSQNLCFVNDSNETNLTIAPFFDFNAYDINDNEYSFWCNRSDSEGKLENLNYQSAFLWFHFIKPYKMYGIWAVAAGAIYVFLLWYFYNRLMTISIFLLNAVITLLQYYSLIKILQYSRSGKYDHCYVSSIDDVAEDMLRVCLYAPITYLCLYILLSLWWRFNNSRCGGNKHCRKAYASAYVAFIYLATIACLILGIMLLVLVITVSMNSHFGDSGSYSWVALAMGILLLLNQVCNQFLWQIGKAICVQIGLSDLGDYSDSNAPFVRGGGQLNPHSEPLMQQAQ